MGKIKVLLADDHAILRSGLRRLLETQPDIEVVAEAADGEEAIRKCSEASPDIALMDITMPGLSGIEATREIRKQNPEVKILVLTMHMDENYLYDVLSAGASGYLPKQAADTELLTAIRSIYKGGNFIHDSMIKWLVAKVRDVEPAVIDNSPDTERLSQRESEVLRLLALGYTSQEIADKLGLSIKSVGTYKARVQQKFGLRGRAELVRYAIKLGLLDTKPQNSPQT